MKRSLVLFLAFTMCICSFFGCEQHSGSSDRGENDGGNKNASSDFFGNGNSDTGDKSNGGSAYPFDILEGLPYTITCIDKYTQSPVEYDFTDNGRLNDGLYRSVSELESETGDDMRVDFEGTSQYNFVITFEADGTRDAYRLIAHNCDFTFSFLKIEVGTDIDDLTELEFEEDFEITANMHADNYADFEVANVNIFRITITTGSSSTTAFDELSLLGVSGIYEDSQPESSDAQSSELPDGDRDPLLIGTWGGNDPEIIEKGGTDYRVIITFKSDGTGIYQQAGAELPFTWTTKNDMLYMNVTLVGPLEKRYNFSNNALYLPDEDGRTTMFVRI